MSLNNFHYDIFLIINKFWEKELLLLLVRSARHFSCRWCYRLHRSWETFRLSYIIELLTAVLSWGG